MWTSPSKWIACLGLTLLASAAEALTWSPPQTLASASATNPSVAANSQGAAVAAWVQGGQVFAALRTSDATWGTGVQLSKAGASAPRASIAANGDAVVAWLEYAPGAVVAAFYRGGQWLPEAMLSTPGADATAVQVEYEGAGIATVVFAESLAGGCNIAAVTGTAAAGWGTPQTLAAECFSYLQLAVNAPGEAAVVWGATSLQGGPVVTATRDAAGSWSGPVTLAPTYYRQYLPGIALGDDGTAVAVWGQYTALKWSRRLPGANWSAVRTLLSQGGSLNGVAVDGTGKAVTIYNTYTVQGTYALRATSLAKSGFNWSRHVPLTSGAQSVVVAQIAASPAGTFVAGWTNSFPTVAMVSTLEPGATAWARTNLGYGDWEVAVAARAGTGIVVWDSLYSAPPKLLVSSAVIQ